MDISFVISERGEPHNLVWTMQCLEQEFYGSGLKYEYVVVVNGPEDEKPLETVHAYQWLQKKWPGIATPAPYSTFLYRSPGGIYQARNLGASVAKGKYLWFLDAHVMPVPGHFRKAFEFKQSFEGILHMGLQYFLDKPGRVVFGYRWKRDMFWGSWTRTPPKPPEYRILMNGGANILMEKSLWDLIGGYNKGLGIYGGGEPYTDIKAQMFGYPVKSHPDFHYYHLAIRRGYYWNSTDMWRNFMITSYSLGGPKYFDLLYASYVKKCEGHPDWMATLERTREEAMVYAMPDFEETSRRAIKTVDQVLDEWREYALAHGHEIDDWPR